MLLLGFYDDYDMLIQDKRRGFFVNGCRVEVPVVILVVMKTFDNCPFLGRMVIRI